MTERIAIVGLGYVGLPVAVGLARHFDGVFGFDIKAERVAALREGVDATREFEPAEMAGLDRTYTDDAAAPGDCTSVFCLMPPIASNRQPEFGPLRRVCPTIGKMLNPSAVVVFESTVYSGATEEVCGAILAEVSGLRHGVEFKLGYSPERINRGDRAHRLESIVKVINGEQDAREARMTESGTWAETNSQSVEVTFVAQWRLNVTRPNLRVLLIPAEFSR